MHKTEDGEIYLIGYVEPAEAEKIESGSEPVTVSLYPEPFGNATALLTLPMSRIDRRHALTRDEGNSMVVEIAPK